MSSKRFASASSLLKWAGTTQCQELDNKGDILVVPVDGLFYYFSLDNERFYNLVMSSERNLAEE